MRCERTKWHGRAAWILANDVLQLTHLSGGGHIVDFRLADRSSVSPLWVPRWKTQEPFQFTSKTDSKKFGEPAVGKLLCGIAGHSLCLDLFGMPSPEEIQDGLTLHGEAGVSKWQMSGKKISGKKTANEVVLTAKVRLPKAGLSFVRELRLREGEPVIYVRETVSNDRAVDRYFQWQQHVTLGPPFLSAKDCRINLPGARGRTFPHGYEGHEALASGKDFDWPYAPNFDRGRVDLRRPLSMDRRGFVAGVRIAPQRERAFVCAVNTRLSLAIGYVFRRKDFPWVALWEENRARKSSPWRGREHVRGLEFGVSPLPMTREENFALGKLFGMPTLAHVRAKGSVEATYAMFLSRVPRGTTAIHDVSVGKDRKSLDLKISSGKIMHSVPAKLVREYLK
jgi:hypothetical protein